MAFQTQTGQFAASTAGTTTTVNTNFQPKAVILWANDNNTNGTTQGRFTFGFGDGTNVKCQNWEGADNVSTTQVTQGLRPDAFSAFTAAGAETNARRISGVAFNSNNFVCTFRATPTTAFLINFIILGGSDITNVFVGEDGIPTTAGTKNVTNVGFQGTAVFFLMHNREIENIGAFGTWGQGFAATNYANNIIQWAADGATANGATTSGTVLSDTRIRNDACIIYDDTGGSASTLVGSFTGWTSNGFNINFTTVPGTLARLFAYLVIQGGAWDAGVQAKPSVGTNQPQKITGSIPPLVLGLFMVSPTVLNTATSTNMRAFGATESANPVYAGMYHNDAIPTVSHSDIESDRLLDDVNSGGSSICRFTSFNTDGWTVTWDAAGTAFLIGWFTAANTGTQPPVPPVTGDVISLAGNIKMGIA